MQVACNVNKTPKVNNRNSKNVEIDGFDYEAVGSRPIPRNKTTESLLRPQTLTRPTGSGRTENKPTLIYSDRIIKFFVCLFFGMIPKLFTHHNRKAYTMFFSICIVAFQWYAVGGYIYCTVKFWSTPSTGHDNTTTNSSSTSMSGISKYLPKIPLETLLLLLGLATSGAITVTIAVHYFYSSKNYFSDGKKSFVLVPRIDLYDEFDSAGPFCDPVDEFLPATLDKNEWLLTNVLFALGVVSVFFVLGTDFGTDTIFDFKGIRAFLKHTTPTNRVVYGVAVSMFFWGFMATVCACCIFHIMSRQIIAFINHTQRLALESVISRQQFFEHHERLIVFTKKMIKKFKYWFAIHNIMFILLVAAMIFEWLSFMKHSEYQHNYLLSQVAGSTLIGYKFAFPFFSASRVTVKFEDFYIKVARRNKFNDIPELLLFPNHFGFKIFGLRITPNVAIIVFLSTFVGFLKFFCNLIIMLTRYIEMIS